MTWTDHSPGDRPVVLVGAGFPIAAIESPPPSTDTFLQKTADEHSAIFPAINALVKGPLSGTTTLSPNRQLNFVWTNLGDFALSLVAQYDSIRKLYDDSVGTDFKNLVQYLLDKNSPSNFLRIVLGVELKRAIALHYNSESIRLCCAKIPNFTTFLSFVADKEVTWVSLNYDLVLEAVLKECLDNVKWKYCFEDWLRESPRNSNASHVIVKPHGSVNVVFETLWKQIPVHSLSFQDRDNMMVTCDHSKVGCAQCQESMPRRERRPWLIGYLPDALKDELNSPVGYADAAHDLSKGNLAYASLRLLHASSLYVLGYSMPLEDQWLWRRVEALPDTRQKAGWCPRIIASL